jgi:hypothetical protein
VWVLARLCVIDLSLGGDQRATGYLQQALASLARSVTGFSKRTR